MSTSCGFFNSLNGDRKYNASHFGKCFEGIILDGILASVGDCFVVKANSGMTVTVGSGKSWYLTSWLQNDADLPVTLDASDVVLGRIDAIVMEFDSTETVRWNDIKYIKGIASSNPEHPTLINTQTVKQIPLAFIEVTASCSEITQSNITNMVGTSECPFVTGILETIDTDELVAQWSDRFDDLFENFKKQIEQTVSGTIIDGSVTTEKLAANAVSETYYGVLSGDSWIKDNGDYYQSINIDGILDSDNPDFDIDFSDISSTEEALNIIDACSVYRVLTYDGGIIARATDSIELDVPIRLRCVRR